MRCLSDAEWSRLFANSGVTSHDARPAGFEPATGGLEVRGDTFAGVRQRPETRIYKGNP